MKKIMTVAALFSVILTQNLFADDIRVLSIKEDHQVLLRDADTGEEWLAMEGDSIEGWIIISIEKNKVVLRKESVEESSDVIVKTIELPNKVVLTPGRG